MISVHTHDNPTGRGAEPRILMESTEPLILEGSVEVVDAVPGDCIIQVPEVRGSFLPEVFSTHFNGPSGNSLYISLVETTSRHIASATRDCILQFPRLCRCLLPTYSYIASKVWLYFS